MQWPAVAAFRGKINGSVIAWLGHVLAERPGEAPAAASEKEAGEGVEQARYRHRRAVFSPRRNHLVCRSRHQDAG